MTRLALLFALLPGVASAADVEVAPPPREAGQPFVEPDAAAHSADDPAETVDRIVKNARSVGDRLAMTDAGADTRKAQGDILRDIDRLLQQAENPPPPPKNDDNKDDQKDNKDKSDQPDNKDQPNPSGGGGDPKPKGGSGGGNPQPKGGGGTSGQNPQPKGGGGSSGRGFAGERWWAAAAVAAAGGRHGRRQAAAAAGRQRPGEGRPGRRHRPEAGGRGGRRGTGPPPPKPMLPIDDEVVKDVWGHLPAKTREQISQYYQEKFMPRYSELLRQYYSSLAEQNRRPAEPRR